MQIFHHLNCLVLGHWCMLNVSFHCAVKFVTMSLLMVIHIQEKQLTVYELVLLKVRTRGSQFTRSIAHAEKYNVFMFSNVSCPEALNVYVTSVHSIIINSHIIRLLCSSKIFSGWILHV